MQIALDIAGDARGYDTIRRVLANLPHTRKGDEIRFMLLGAVDGDGAEMAEKFGISKQAWQQRINRWFNATFGKMLTGQTIKGRDDVPK